VKFENVKGMRFIVEKERRTPITDEAGEVASGGGPAGVAAALSAKMGVQPRKLDHERVIDELVEQGFCNLRK